MHIEITEKKFVFSLEEAHGFSSLHCMHDPLLEMFRHEMNWSESGVAEKKRGGGLLIEEIQYYHVQVYKNLNTVNPPLNSKRLSCPDESPNTRDLG